MLPATRRGSRLDTREHLCHFVASTRVAVDTEITHVRLSFIRLLRTKCWLRQRADIAVGGAAFIAESRHDT